MRKTLVVLVSLFLLALSIPAQSQQIIDERAYDLAERLFSLPAFQFIPIILLALVVVLIIVAVVMYRIFSWLNKRDEGQSKFEQSLVNVIAGSNENHADANRTQAAVATSINVMNNTARESFAVLQQVVTLQQQQINMHTANRDVIITLPPAIEALTKAQQTWGEMVMGTINTIRGELAEVSNGVADIQRSNQALAATAKDPVTCEQLQEIIDSKITPIMARLNDLLRRIPEVSALSEVEPKPE